MMHLSVYYIACSRPWMDVRSGLPGYGVNVGVHSSLTANRFCLGSRYVLLLTPLVM